jgi:hypothetical protein
MPVFLITPLSHNADQVGEAVKRAIPADHHHELQGRAGWLVTHPGTSVEVSQLLGISSQDPEAKLTVGSALVTLVGSYYGRGATTMWEWLKTRFESQR